MLTNVTTTQRITMAEDEIVAINTTVVILTHSKARPRFRINSLAMTYVKRKYFIEPKLGPRGMRYFVNFPSGVCL